MSDFNPLPSKESGEQPASRTSRGRWRWLAVGAVVVVVSGIVTAVALTANRVVETGAPPASTTAVTTTSRPASATTTTTTVPATTVTTSTSMPRPNQPTAATALAPFFAAATTLDRQLHAAASAINRSGPPWPTVSPAVAKAVRTADLAPVATSLPAGLPAGLLRSVVLVYSDLASRRYAMADFSVAGTVDPRTYPNSDDMRHHLRNGHAAAARFTDDLAAARALAGATPAPPALPATSREAAEVQLYARYVEGINGGCDARGGHVITELPEIVWNGKSGTGTIADVSFTAEPGTDGTWHVRLIAC
jgi:hypothetical protein